MQAAERVLERLAEIEAVGDAGQRIVAGEPLDLFLGSALLGDVLLNVDPAAVDERLIGHQELAPVGEILDVREGAALGELDHVIGEPLRLVCHLFGAIAPGLALHVIADDVRQRRARARQLRGQRIHFAIAVIADDQALLGVKHRQPAHHVVERDIEPGIELLELLFLLEQESHWIKRSGDRSRLLIREIPAPTLAGLGASLPILDH